MKLTYLFYERRDCRDTGHMFPCTPDGRILVERLLPREQAAMNRLVRDREDFHAPKIVTIEASVVTA